MTRDFQLPGRSPVIACGVPKIRVVQELDPPIDLLDADFYVNGAREAYAWMRQHAPVYFDAKKACDYRATTSGRSLEGFRRLAGDPHFQTTPLPPTSSTRPTSTTSPTASTRPTPSSSPPSSSPGSGGDYANIYGMAHEMYRDLRVVKGSADAEATLDRRYVAALKGKFSASSTEPPTQYKAPPPSAVPIATQHRAIYFETNSAAMSLDSRAVVDEIAGFMRAYGNTVVDIEGNTDATGARAYNVTLSRQRADTVTAAFRCAAASLLPLRRRRPGASG